MLQPGVDFEWGLPSGPLPPGPGLTSTTRFRWTRTLVRAGYVFLLLLLEGCAHGV